MVDTFHDRRAAAQDLMAHQQTFHVFNRLVLFAVLHVFLVLGCLALALLGNAPWVALVLALVGTIALLTALAVS